MHFTKWLNAMRYRSVQTSRRRSPRASTTVAMVEMLETRKLLSAAPVIAELGPTMAYTEGAPPVPVANHATVTDASAAFANSKLTVTTTNGTTGDLLGVLNGAGVGMGANGAVMFAASSTATPVQIGTATGGAGNAPLIITFNSKATQASVQAVLDEVGYGNGTSTLAIPDRTISFVFTDGSGSSSTAVTKAIHINPAPVVGNVGIPCSTTEGAPPIPVSPTATINDAANAYANSTITVKVTNGQAGDQLGIGVGGGVALGANGTVMFAASPTATPVAVGTVTGGTGTTALVVTFNASATKASVQAVLDHVIYGNGTSTLQTPDRQISIAFTDGNHVASAPVVKVIHLVPAPVIGMPGDAPVNYTVNAAAVVLAPTATIADAATGGFTNSKLSVQLSGGAADDRLGIKTSAALKLGDNHTILYNNVIVGSFSGGAGSQALVISFNASANHDSVQAVLQSITFSYSSTSATPVVTNRLATFSFTDHNNVSAVSKVRGIHVTK